MKRTIFTIILAFVANMMSSQVLTRYNEKLDTLCQSKFIAVYLYTIQTSDADGNPVTDSLQLALQVGEKVWKTWAFERYQYEKSGKDSLTYLPFLHNEALMHIATTTVGYPEGKITAIESIVPRQYEVTEDIEKPVWKNAKGKESVCGYQCRKATCEFRGKKWNVCYTADIPTAAGPWKLHGLKGLITYASDEEGIHTFRLISVDEEAVPITYSSGYPITKWVHDENGETQLEKDVKPYVEVTREKCQEMKKELFGDSRYLTNPTYFNSFYLYGAEHYDPDLNVIEKFNGEKYSFKGGLYLVDKAHKYQPLELK